MSLGPEWEMVERPLLDHLASLGWDTLIWGEQQPSDDCDRSSERDVLLEKRLRLALWQFNLGPNNVEWLDEARINSAIAELRSMPAGAKLLEANRLSTELLLGGVTVPGLDGWDGGRDQTINYIDWDDWSANDFLAVSQFRVATPGQAKDIRPDVTLFVNGIPLVVIEAKPPGKESAIADAIDQLRRYANQRGSQVAEGSEQLFWTNQFTVATTGERAEAGTFSAQAEH
ncbi:type I restriction endonuclease [Ilumatobacter sp.]|uniref:type I restriction endonuclease n=1 Tax=Ilumatobacter sp. TaxID=1967498 RepID=UPI003B515DEC